MKCIRILTYFFSVVLLISCQSSNQQKDPPLHELFTSPPEDSKPWVFWYWMRAAVSAEGITADLEAMKEAGIGGAYLMPLKNVSNPPLYEPAMVQLTPEWWEMVRHAFHEADRLGLKLALHACDGFALSGGPWITPELSMQKVVWTDTLVSGGRTINMQLPQPEIKENYYRDIALYAYPAEEGVSADSIQSIPEVTTSSNADASFLTHNESRDTFKSDEPCWIQYRFNQPFTCRSVVIGSRGNNYQAQRLILEVSNDGEKFTSLGRLEVPRHGWQDSDEDYTHAIEPVTATCFRFVYDPADSEPGAEDLDAAKWKPSLKLSKLYLSERPKIHHFEGKNGSVWRIASPTTEKQVGNGLCLDPEKIITLTDQVTPEGTLEWEAPKGQWILLRMGHTSTGHTNYTGGGGLGLEVDKFNPEAVQFQFDQWFGKAVETVGNDLAARVLKIFHVDSWECGSQNWTNRFPEEFKQRRGYDLLPFLPVMAGIPVKSASESEKVLYDIRQTIVELTSENFYSVYKNAVQKFGVQFSAECIAPTMLSDGLLHYSIVDIPMGEFWLRSPTHDKPNDALDAISGGRIYGKNIIQAECFTELRMAWDEYPGMLKTLGDRQYALGFNKFVYHIFTQNPWMDRKPGMTLDPIGLFFQRDQTWWKPGKAWVTYATRCQALLQQGDPVTDIAVFTGEELPRRANLPERLISALPGLVGKEKIEAEVRRMKNEGQPIREMPRGVFHTANITNPEDWIDPLHGYAYDSFNPDALLRLAKVRQGRVVFSSGNGYALLVWPGKQAMNPLGNELSEPVAEKLSKLVSDGATILFTEAPVAARNDIKAQRTIQKLFQGDPLVTSDQEGHLLTEYRTGKGKIMIGPYPFSDLKPLNLEPDFMAFGSDENRAKALAWTHRAGKQGHIYFISNQLEQIRNLSCSFRVTGYQPELFDAVSGQIIQVPEWSSSEGRTHLNLNLPENGSIFVIFSEKTSKTELHEQVTPADSDTLLLVPAKWQVDFNPAFGGPDQPVDMDGMTSWTTSGNPQIKYYSGTAVYRQTLKIDHQPGHPVWIKFEKVANLAQVRINGTYCGVAWTFPYQLRIDQALKPGNNQIEIEVTNTWANRLIGDQLLPEAERITWTTAPYMLEGKPLLEAGLLGRIVLLEQKE